jgi:hypothetical protein
MYLYIYIAPHWQGPHDEGPCQCGALHPRWLHFDFQSQDVVDLLNLIHPSPTEQVSIQALIQSPVKTNRTACSRFDWLPLKVTHFALASIVQAGVSGV